MHTRTRQYHNKGRNDYSREDLIINSPVYDLHRYIDGKVDAATTCVKLDAHSSQGNLFAGEIAIEQARRHTQKANALAWLTYADLALSRAVDLDQMYGKPIGSVGARAIIQRAQLPVHAQLLDRNRLPDKELAANIYKSTVSAGMGLLRSIHLPEVYTDEEARSHAQGTLSEIAALSLAQRFALREIGSDTWFPHLSLVSEDKKNRRGSSVNHKWDITILGDRGDGPVVDERVEIKTSMYLVDPLLQRGNPIKSVFVYPDLALSERERCVPEFIVDECNLELSQPGMATISRRLDQRTEQFLDRLEAA